MKRIPEYQKPDGYIRKRWTLFFWVECDVCKREVRREWVWKIFIKNVGLEYATVMSIYHDVCCECLPTLDAVVKYRLKERDKKPRRPPSGPYRPSSNTVKAALPNEVF